MNWDEYRRDVDSLPFSDDFEKRTEAMLRERVRSTRNKERKNMKMTTFSRVGKAAVAVAATFAFTVTAYAAVSTLGPADVADTVGDAVLAKAFASEDAVQINETQQVGDYNVTLAGIVSGKELSEFSEDAQMGSTYAVIAVQRADGAPITEEEAYGPEGETELPKSYGLADDGAAADAGNEPTDDGIEAQSADAVGLSTDDVVEADDGAVGDASDELTDNGIENELPDDAVENEPTDDDVETISFEINDEMIEGEGAVAYTMAGPGVANATVTPLVSGYKPWQVNGFTLGMSLTSFERDGVLYYLMETQDLNVFADNTVYLAFFMDGLAPSADTFAQNADGSIAYADGVEGALFELPLDASKADPEAAADLVSAFVSEAE